VSGLFRAVACGSRVVGEQLGFTVQEKRRPAR